MKTYEQGVRDAAAVLTAKADELRNLDNYMSRMLAWAVFDDTAKQLLKLIETKEA